jgi:NADPH:quinone reductase-like Zn-dependent oxidoreductase
VVNSKQNPEWGAKIKEATAGAGADVIVETMGPDTIEQSRGQSPFMGRLRFSLRGKNKPNIEIPSSAYSTTLATIRGCSSAIARVSKP